MPAAPPPTVVSVGYEGRTLDEVAGALAEHGVTVVVDVRQAARSRNRGFAKTRLAEGLAARGIGYEHLPGLGNPKDNRDLFRSGDPEGRRRYRAHLAAVGPEDLARLAQLVRAEQVALLCLEADHRECHRSAVVEALAEGPLPGVRAETV